MSSFFDGIRRPIKTVVSKEPVVFWISFASSCVFGQIAILGGMFLAAGRSISFSDVFLQNLSSANMYTFAIALLAAACSMQVIEFIDGMKEKKFLQLPNHKAASAVIAALLVVLQAMISGNLLRDSLAPSAVQPGSLASPAVGLADPANLMQLVFWIASMVVAQYMFCLTRMHLHPEEIAQMVQAQASHLAGEAHNVTTTKDGEDI